MKHPSRTVSLVTFLLAAACGCGTDSGTARTDMPDAGLGSAPDGPGVTDKLCNRADSCNILNGSVEECVQFYDAILNPLPKNQHAEFDLAIKECLAHPSCNVFQVCINDIFE